METRETKQEIEKTHRKTRSILGRVRMAHATLEEIRDLLVDGKKLLTDIHAIYRRNDRRERMK